jgi:hypothetical protein
VIRVPSISKSRMVGRIERLLVAQGPTRVHVRRE